MTWLKLNATAITRSVAAVRNDGWMDDPRIVNEVFGIVARCAADAECYHTGTRVSLSMATAVAGPLRVKHLLTAAIDAGLMAEVNPLLGQHTFAINREIFGPL